MIPYTRLGLYYILYNEGAMHVCETQSKTSWTSQSIAYRKELCQLSARFLFMKYIRGKYDMIFTQINNKAILNFTHENGQTSFILECKKDAVYYDISNLKIHEVEPDL